MVIANRRAITPTHRDPEAKPWDRFRQEPALWYERFSRFRRLGAKRAIRQAYLEDWKERYGWKEGDARKLPVNVPPVWHAAAEQWRWRTRADAWDVQKAADDSEAEQQVIRDERAMRVRIIKGLRAKLVTALNALPASSFRPGEILMGIKIVNDEMRKEMGDDRRRDDDEGSGVIVHVVNLPPGSDLSHFARPPDRPQPAIAAPPQPSVDAEHRELGPDEPGEAAT